MTLDKINGIISFGSVHPKKKTEHSSVPMRESRSLERSPKKDAVTFTKVAKAARSNKIKSKKKDNPVNLQKKLEIIKDEKLLTNELLYFLEPKEENGNKVFTPSQTKIINSAFDKLVFFKEIALELADDAKKYGEQVYNDMVEIFGGQDGFGKYILPPRMKDDVSVFNKLVKEFKNEHIKTEIHNIFSKKLYNKPYVFLDKDERELVKLSINSGEVELDSKDFNTIEKTFKSNPQNGVAQKLYSKPYQNLSNDEKKKVNDLIYENDGDLVYNASNMLAREEAINWIRDLLGIRMVLPTGNRAELTKVEKYIDKAVQNGEMDITRFSNYHGNHILPYIKREKVLQWKEQIPGMVLVENSQVRKKNGYTTTQMNINHYVDGRRKPILVEFQLRTDALNEIGNREHLIYDILENKDITKGIPELKTYYDSLGIVKAVKEVFQDPKLEDKYIDYERSYYSYLRNVESENEHSMDVPLLTNYGLGQYEGLLSFEALEVIEKKASAIKKAYSKQPELSNREKLEYLYKLQ